MGWWSQFDRAEVAADFARIAGSGLDSVRVFLTWEDFQPAPDEVDLATTERLASLVPVGKTLVSESGIFTREDVRRLAACGVHAVLIGEALLTVPDPAGKIREIMG